ncbi:MAG: hypothetical protein EYR95_06670, partial [Phormidium sp. SL48-SHIP]
LNAALSTVGHTGTWVDDPLAKAGRSPYASGDLTATLAGANLSGQVGSLNEESPRRDSWGVSKLQARIGCVSDSVIHQ